jgi:hypothetical protein
MNLKRIREKLRTTAEDEAKQDAAFECEIERCRSSWVRRAKFVGALCITTVLAVIPFLQGYPFHPYWERAGKYLVLLAMGCWLVFVYVAATAWVFWNYLQSIKRIHHQYALKNKLRTFQKRFTSRSPKAIVYGAFLLVMLAPKTAHMVIAAFRPRQYSPR